MTKSNQNLIVFIVLGVILLGLGVYSLITISAKNGEISKLTNEKNALADENAKLETELATSKESLSANTNAFENHKELIKEYTSYNKVITQDVQAVVLATQKYYSEQSYNYEINDKLVDDYEQQLNIFKEHVNEYKILLNENKNDLEDLGIEADVEISLLESTMPQYENQLYDMRDYVENLK